MNSVDLRAFKNLGSIIEINIEFNLEIACRIGVG